KIARASRVFLWSNARRWSRTVFSRSSRRTCASPRVTLRSTPPLRGDHMETTVSLSALARAARVRTQPITTRRPDRLPGRDRRWEWAALRFSDNDSDPSVYVPADARDKWSFDSAGSSPATMRRSAGAGSAYWLSRRDRHALPLRGECAYELSVPLPV